jgi:hypothetical protein
MTSSLHFFNAVTTSPSTTRRKFSSLAITVKNSHLEETMPLVEESPFRQAVDMCVTREPELWDPMSPAFEAQGLFALLENGNTVDDIRRLIEVPADVQASLRAFIRSYPEESFEIEYMLSFRQRVAQEFERIIAMVETTN